MLYVHKTERERIKNLSLQLICHDALHYISLLIPCLQISENYSVLRPNDKYFIPFGHYFPARMLIGKHPCPVSHATDSLVIFPGLKSFREICSFSSFSRNAILLRTSFGIFLLEGPRGSLSHEEENIRE